MQNYKSLIGFINNNCNCYLNSALQILLLNDRLCMYIDLIPNDHEVILMLKEIVRIKKDSNNVTYTKVAMLKRILSKYNVFFKEMGQQDCHECIIALMDVIHEITKNDKKLPRGLLLDTFNKDLIKESEKYWEKIENSIINRIYGGQLKTKLTCMECNKSRHKYDLINNISISINSNENLIDCLLDYYKLEILDKENKVKCDNCKKNTKTKKFQQYGDIPKL